MEQTNITYRRLGVHYSRWPLKIFPNKLDRIFYGVGCAGNSGLGMNTEAQLKAIAPVLATLALNFKLQGKPEEIEKLKPLAQMVPTGSPESQELQKLIAGLL